jgi:hypothetical protein
MVNTRDAEVDTMVVATSSPCAPLSAPRSMPPPPSSPERILATSFHPSPAASPAAYSWSPPVVLGDLKQYYPREASGGFWIVYLRGANESFRQVVDIVQRIFWDATGRYLVERRVRPDGRAIVDIWLCFVHRRSATSVMSTDIWGRKGAQGGVIHVEWPRFSESRKQFFTTKIGKLACTGAVNTEGSFAGLMSGLQKAAEVDAERMRVKRTQVRKNRLPRGDKKKG